MANFLGGLLSAASNFLPGGGLLSKIIPGAVNAIGDIAGKVINRPKGQGIGEALLEAAPGALMNAAGLAQTANEHINAPTKSDVPDNKGTTEYFIDHIYMNRGDLYPDMNSKADAARYLKNNPEEYVKVYGEQPDSDIIAKYDVPGQQVQSTSATDHLPVRHGPASQPPALPIVQNASGPFASHGMPPAAAYVDEKMHKQERPQTSNEQVMTQALYHPNMLGSRLGGPTMMDRTQQQSFGTAPSFNMFDQFTRRPPPRQVVEINEPTIYEDERPDRTVIRYIKRKVPKSKRRR